MARFLAKNTLKAPNFRANSRGFFGYAEQLIARVGAPVTGELWAKMADGRPLDERFTLNSATNVGEAACANY